MFCIELIAILILILVLSKHSLWPRIPLHGLLLFYDKENVLYRTNSNPYSDISSIQTFSLSQNRNNYYSRTKRMFCIELILEQDHYYSRTKRMFCIEIIAILILILVLSKHSLCHYYRDYYYSRTKRMFCIEIIAILILILVLSKHSLCPRIPEQGLLLFQDKENVWIELILEQG